MTRSQSILPSLFERLCHVKRAQGRWIRMVDLTMGLYQTSKRSGDAERELAEINF